MLKWENGEAGSWVGRADGFEYRTIVDFFDSECSQQKAELQARHDARIASIAAANGYVKLADDEMVVKRLKGGEISFGTANIDDVARHFGYVKLEPGQCVVQVEDLTRIVTWFKGDARTVPHADMDTTLNRFTAALDAIKEARDE